MQPKIFLSYSWNNTDVADEIDEDWKKIGLTFIRDVRDLGFKENLNQFMKRVHESDYVLLLISKDYLESKNCMYEALEVFENPDFARKILPILTQDAQLGKTLARLSYTEHWHAEAKALEKALKRATSSPAILASVLEDLRQVTKVANSFDSFADAIRSIRYASWPQIKKQGYAEIFAHIGYNQDERAILEECSRITNLHDAEDQEIALEELQSKYHDNAYVLYTESSIAYKESKYKKTKMILDKLLALYPDYYLAYYSSGVVLEKHLQDYESARQQYERAVAINPNFADAHRALGALAQRAHKYEEAQAYYEKALAINPNDGYAHHGLAVMLSRLKINPDKARYHYEQAISLNPEDAEIYYNYALLLGNYFQDFVEARRQYEYAISLKPNHSKAHNNLASILNTHFEEYESARQHLEQSVELHPGNDQAQYNLAMLLIDIFEEYAKGRKHFEICLDITPTNAIAHANYADLLDNHFKEHAKARQHYEYSVALAPENVATRQRLASLLVKHFQDYKGALNQLQQVLIYRPNSADAYYNIAIVLYKSTDYTSCRSHYEQALALDNTHLLSHFNLGNLLGQHFGDYMGERQHYKAVLAIDPDNVTAHESLGIVLAKEFGDYNGARHHFERALAIDPNRPISCANLGVILSSHLNLPSEARYYFERGLRLAPDAPILHINYAAFLLNQNENIEARKHYMAACALDSQYKTPENDALFGA